MPAGRAAKRARRGGPWRRRAGAEAATCRERRHGASGRGARPGSTGRAGAEKRGRAEGWPGSRAACGPSCPRARSETAACPDSEMRRWARETRGRGGGRRAVRDGDRRRFRRCPDFGRRRAASASVGAAHIRRHGELVVPRAPRRARPAPIPRTGLSRDGAQVGEQLRASCRGRPPRWPRSGSGSTRRCRSGTRSTFPRTRRRPRTALGRASC
jgi:hypothetical protein